ncbi:MAG: hypothetical protein HRT55_16590 [Colwellia sp.]|uniref:hypothetical protein n=1 Tax=Colwellia sp. TaxID=56799 RepID=UPI0025C23D69|nr:hypothetical protein [Colwellia sp.]NQZ27925.1 hypothetical protein [Colwellia sp.]
MKLPSLVLLALCISFFSKAERITAADKTFVEASKISSWNHIREKLGVYAELNQAAHKYQLYKRLASSPGKALYELTLVKKLINWEQQHSNGFEVSLDNLNLNLSVEQLNQLHFKIKLSPEKSIITSSLETLSKQNTWLKNTYNYKVILLVQANFTLMFYGENHGNSKQKTLYAAYPFKLDIDSKQHWHAINIKPEDLNYYWQQNYQEEPALVTQVATQKWQGFILVAESGNSKVVRNYIPTSFPKEYTEIFNELDITLTNLYITSSP